MKCVTYVSQWYDPMNGSQYSVNRPAVLIDEYTLIYKTDDSLEVRRSQTPLEVQSDGAVIDREARNISGIEIELNESGTKLLLSELTAMKFAELTKYLKIERGF